MPLFLMLYQNGYISSWVLDANLSIALSLFLTSVVISYLLAKGKSLSGIVDGLGLSKDKISKKNIAIGVLLFVLILITEMIVSIFSAITGIDLPTNVGAVLFGMPIYFLLFTFLITPINEEIFFRGFLVPRFGIVMSALLFSVPHLISYSSISQFVAAFIFGLLAGYFFKRSKSLYPAIVAHALINVLAIIAVTSI